MSETIRQGANRADLNTLADLLRKLGFGDILANLTTTLRKSATAAVAYSGASPAVSSQVVPAASIQKAFARSGGGGTGVALAIVATVPPAAGQISIAPNGSIITAAADAWTSVDVAYTPEKGDIVEFTGDVAANVLLLPQNILNAGVVRLLEAEALVGTSTGKKFVDAIGAAAAAGEAALNAAMTQVNFAVADAVTRARVKVLVCSEKDVSALLASDNTSLI